MLVWRGGSGVQQEQKELPPEKLLGGVERSDKNKR
jgi:hypothetical protein